MTGQLRCGWRVLFFIAIALVGAVVLTLLFSFPAVASLRNPQQLTAKFEKVVSDLLMLSTAISFIFTGVWAARKFENLPPLTLGVAMRGPWLRAMGLGVFLGFLTIAIFAGAMWVGGAATFHWQSIPAAKGMELATVAITCLLVAVMEEVVFHGYAFQTLLRGVGPLAAVLIIAISGTAFVYLGQGSFPFISPANTFVLLTLLGMAYLRMGSLWLPIGLSAGWSLALLLLNQPMQGVVQRLSPLTMTLHGPSWLTGGAFGPEGGAAVAAILLSLLALITYTPVGLKLESRWWEWRELTSPRRATPPIWDFLIGSRAYQWKLLLRDNAE